MLLRSWKQHQEVIAATNKEENSTDSITDQWLTNLDFIHTTHAQQRMMERKVTKKDLQCCLESVASLEKHEGKYEIKGKDRNNNWLKLIIAPLRNYSWTLVTVIRLGH